MITYTQAVCLNGHQVTARYTENGGFAKFCELCGAEVITKCPTCENYIDGDYSIESIVDLTHHDIAVPKFCKHCGSPYPWTKAAIQASNELIELSELSETDKESFKESIPDLMNETPKTSLAVAKFNKFSKKAGDVIAKALYSIVVDVSSDVIVKQLNV